MITPKIAANQAFSQLNRVSKHDDQQRQPTAGAGNGTRSTHTDSDGVKTDISVFAAHPLQQFNTEFNAVVKSIRIADKAMAEIAANVEQMESEVEMFLKQYPPYPPGSEDRVQYLSRFAMLRRQIDKLTIPPDAGARKIIGRSETGDSNDWEIEIRHQKIGRSIKSQPVHTGKEGLNLPKITTDATDEQIAGLQKALSQARRVIKQRREGLAQDATQVLRTA
jgi:hypothetical protein